MGFDLYGENPVMRNINEDAYPVYNEYAGMDFKEQMKIFKEDNKLEKQYYEEWRKRDNDNPGTYFRSNCWWWRRLWAFSGTMGKGILTEEDIDSGNYNDNYLISEEKASALAKVLQASIDDGTAKGYEDSLREEYAKCEKDKHDNPVDFDRMYPFTVGHLKEFITFCSESGGFTIG